MGTKSLLCHACHADLPLGKDNQRFIKCPFCGCAAGLIAYGSFWL